MLLNKVGKIRLSFFSMSEVSLLYRNMEMSEELGSVYLHFQRVFVPFYNLNKVL